MVMFLIYFSDSISVSLWCGVVEPG